MLEKVLANPVGAVFVMFILAWIVVAVAVFPGGTLDTVNFVPVTYEAVVDVLMPVLFVALLVERLLEVFVSGARKHERQPLERRLLKAKEKLNQLHDRSSGFQVQLDAPGAEALTDAQRGAILARQDVVTKIIPEAQRNVREAEAAMDKFKGITRKIAYVSGTLLGLVIGLAGIRSLAPLVDFQLANWTAFQRFVFHSVDIALTAALLAGGAAGIHQVISVFGDYTQKARKDAQS